MKAPHVVTLPLERVGAGFRWGGVLVQAKADLADGSQILTVETATDIVTMRAEPSGRTHVHHGSKR